MRNLLDIQVEDVIDTGLAALERHDPRSPEAVMNAPERLVRFSPELESMISRFRAFLFDRVYFSDSVLERNRRAVRLLENLFRHYLAHPESMGRKARARLAREGLRRTVCDYVSGFTDRYALAEAGRRTKYAPENEP